MGGEKREPVQGMSGARVGAGMTEKIRYSSGAGEQKPAPPRP